MKTKEQLAEEYVNARHPNDPRVTADPFKQMNRNNSRSAFLAGFEAGVEATDRVRDESDASNDPAAKVGE